MTLAEMAIDPVCGSMRVNAATAKLRTEHLDKTSYFCSARCREKFVAYPPAYLGGPPFPVPVPEAPCTGAIGSAMGGTDVATESAQVTLVKGQLGAITPSPMIAALAMSLGSVSVVSNALHPSTGEAVSGRPI